MTDLRTDFEIAASARSGRIRVMIVDDSVVARSVFARILGGDPKINIVCEASNSEDALGFLQSNEVDIILLDIELPGRSGLEALPDILEKSPNARILVVSLLAERNGPAAINALSLGAYDTLAKPSAAGYSGDFARQLTKRVIRLGRRVERRSHATALCRPTDEDIDPLEMPDCIAIGASTGGIPPIYSILEKLESKVDCPIFITQHLPAAFMEFFAKQLSKLSRRNVEIADAGRVITKNTIYLAGGDSHLCVGSSAGRPVFVATDPDTRSRYCPSVDIMLTSLAEVYGDKMLAVILSGMGNDGAAGARNVVNRGAKIIVQDADSSVIWGMPGAIAKNKLAFAMLPPEEIVARLNNVSVGKKMKPAIDPYEFLVALLKKRTGQVFASNRHWRIEMVLKPIMQKQSIPDLSMLAALLESDPDSVLANECVEAMINNETCFFRDQANFALMTGPVIDTVRERRKQSRRLRIWSAACSTGQEAYSIAIAIAENVEKWRGWDVEIVATDVSWTSLEKARVGTFSQFEIQRGLPVTMMLKYFNQKGEDWTVDSGIRKMISFAKHNQLDTAHHLGKFDVILCRNMLMYLSGENKMHALENLSSSLRGDGYLMLGAAETVIGQNEFFRSSTEFRGLHESVNEGSSNSGIRLSA